MPDLRCTVQTCTHNQNYYCNLDSIVVGGNSAKKADETSCDSFEERKGGSSYSNAYSDMAGKEASAKSDVDCKATDCMYSVSCRKDQCRRRECLSLSRDGMRDVQMWMCVIFGRKDAQVICIRSVNKRYR